MANKKSTPPSARTKEPSKVPLAPAKGTPKAPAAIEQADGSPKPTNTNAGADPTPSDEKRASKGSPNTNSLRTYEIADYRLERPEFRIYLSGEGTNCEYRIEGDLSATCPPIRESKYLSREQCLEIYRWMLLNRRMETALESLYKQSKVVGGVYFGLGQEGCSCASAYALGADDWLGPMIRNQGAMLVRGFSARDIMRQYMAKADSPTFGRVPAFANSIYGRLSAN